MEAVLRRNMPAVERKREMLEAALEIFAQKGPAITVQELADRVGVTQPLVHRYFPVKSDLIAAIRDVLKSEHWNPEWENLLRDETVPLHDRLVRFYASYLPEMRKDRWFRGFMHAALDRPSFAGEYLETLEVRLFRTIALEARRLHGFPAHETVPLFGRELELVWSMHSAMAMMGVRKHIYKMPIHDDMETVMADQIESYLLIAPKVMARLMPKAV